MYSAQMENQGLFLLLLKLMDILWLTFNETRIQPIGIKF